MIYILKILVIVRKQKSCILCVENIIGVSESCEKKSVCDKCRLFYTTSSYLTFSSNAQKKNENFLLSKEDPFYCETRHVQPIQINPQCSIAYLGLSEDSSMNMLLDLKKWRRPKREGCLLELVVQLKGNSLEFGKIGLRLKSQGIRMHANQLQAADKVLRRELRPTKSKLYTRFVCDLAVCIKGNQTRMGKGKRCFRSLGK